MMTGKQAGHLFSEVIMNEYRIVLSLTESEFAALAISGRKELRSPRNQARYLLRQNLVALGLISDLPLESITPPKGAIS
jgi:hypothetical protein